MSKEKRYKYIDPDLIEEENDYEGEKLSRYDAALIWQFSGEDEDYIFGYSEDELRDTLK